MTSLANLFRTNLYKLLIVLGLSIVLVSLAAPFAYAQSKEQVCAGLGQNYDAASNDCVSRTPGAATPDAQVGGIVQAALNIISIVIGIAGVIMVMLGGFRYITSGGDASKTASAQNTILWALVGLAIAALAQVIVGFVLNRI